MVSRFLTVLDLSERHHRSVRGIYMDHYRGVGPKAHKIGGRLLFLEHDVEEWERSHVDEKSTKPSPDPVSEPTASTNERPDATVARSRSSGT